MQNSQIYDNCYISIQNPLAKINLQSPKGNIYQFRNQTLGKGTYGEVQLVQEIHNHWFYALKIISKDQMIAWNAQQNILQEIQIQQQLNHPNILPIFDVFEDDIYLYMVFEYCSGGNLADLLKSRGTLGEQEAFKYFYGMLQGVQYLHENHIIHRDLKPENILITMDDKVKICDFNWATKLKGQAQADPVLCGTTQYMPPEVVCNEKHGFKVDVWSLGIILYELLHGRAPFSGRCNEEKIKDIMSKKDVPLSNSISEDARTVISIMLQHNQAMRPSAKYLFYSGWIIKMLRLNNIIHPYDTKQQKRKLDYKRYSPTELPQLLLTKKSYSENQDHEETKSQKQLKQLFEPNKAYNTVLSECKQLSALPVSPLRLHKKNVLIFSENKTL